MKVEENDISLMNNKEAIRFFTGNYHLQVERTLFAINRQLALALENREIHDKIKTVSNHFHLIEETILSHKIQEGKVLSEYIEGKDNIGHFTSINLFAIKKEHETILKMLETLAVLCNNYVCDESEHVLLKLCMAKLNNFEQDMRRNIYFENNIFFPKILKGAFTEKD